MQALGEGAPHRHHLAHALHLGGEVRLGARELLEGEAGDLGHHIVDGRLEAGRGGAGDVISELIQGVAHGQARGDLGDRKAGGLGGQGRGAGNPGVHLDHHHASVGGIDRELHVGAAGLHADLAQHGDRGRAHPLIFLVRQGQGRGDGHAVAGVDPHGIDVLDGADDDAIVRPVADHLHLILLPAENALLDQHLGGGREGKAPLHDLPELRHVIGYSTPGPRQSERGADDRGQTHQGLGLQRLFKRMGDPREGAFQADGVHGQAEFLAVFRLVDGGGLGADHLHPELFQHPGLFQLQGGVQGCLAPHGGEQGVGPFGLDDARQGFKGNRLDIGHVRHFRVGHDRGGIRVDEDDLVAVGP